MKFLLSQEGNHFKLLFSETTQAELYNLYSKLYQNLLAGTRVSNEWEQMASKKALDTLTQSFFLGYEFVIPKSLALAFFENVKVMNSFGAGHEEEYVVCEKINYPELLKQLRATPAEQKKEPTLFESLIVRRPYIPGERKEAVEKTLLDRNEVEKALLLFSQPKSKEAIDLDTLTTLFKNAVTVESSTEVLNSFLTAHKKHLELFFNVLQDMRLKSDRKTVIAKGILDQLHSDKFHLERAVVADNVAEVKKLTKKAESGKTLDLICKFGGRRLTDFVTKNQLPLDESSSSEPALIAAKHGNLSLVNFLNGKWKVTKEIFLVAAQYGDFSIMNAMYYTPSETFTRLDLTRALMLAAKNGQTTMCVDLCQKGAGLSVIYCNKDGVYFMDAFAECMQANQIASMKWISSTTMFDFNVELPKVPNYQSASNYIELSGKLKLLAVTMMIEELTPKPSVCLIM